MPKQIKETLQHAKAARVGAPPKPAVPAVHNSPATFRDVLARFRWMKYTLKGVRALEGDFLTQSKESPLHRNTDLELSIGPRSVKNHPDSPQKLDKPLLKAMGAHMYRPPYIFGKRNSIYCNMTVTAMIPRKPKFAKGETMHVVGIGDGQWKLVEKLVEATAVPAPEAPEATTAVSAPEAVSA